MVLIPDMNWKKLHEKIVFADELKILFRTEPQRHKEKKADFL